MRGLVLSFVALVCISLNAFAYEGNLGIDYHTLSPYDVVAPSLNGVPAGADRQVGQLFLDVSTGTTGTFKAVGKDGSVVSLNSGTGSPVTSGGTERIERIRVSLCSTSPCSITDQSGSPGSWVGTNSVVRNSAGNYTMTITNGVFSGAPTCNVTSSGGVFCFGNATSATNFDYQCRLDNGVNTDAGVGIICMGSN
jgi:hypothetical protein